MSEKEKKDVWVRVKDNAGNEFICPLDALKERKSATDEELENCVDDATVGRYAGNIEIAEKGN
jgi:hypothetical protein